MRRKVGLIAAAALAMGGLAQSAPTTVRQDKNTIVVQEKVADGEKRKVRQSRELPPDGIGGVSFPFYDRGRSPKEYGQWLQATGRQKWVKKSK